MNIQLLTITFSAINLTDLAPKGTAILIAAILIAGCMHHRAAAARHTVWALALGCLLVLPLLIFSGLNWRISSLPWLVWGDVASVPKEAPVSPQVTLDGVERLEDSQTNQPGFNTRPHTLWYDRARCPLYWRSV
ncbi:MAG: hypothetical protein JW829_17130 [Pirellulales bacterium]|nr:hypothetical protein [Pirellulales bacterium]